MNGKAVIDTNILIYCSKGELNFEDLVLPYEELFISAITFMEVMGFNYTDFIEKRNIEIIVNNCNIIHTDNTISYHVITYRRAKKIKLPDAIILATARKLDADLITINNTDFKNLDSSVKIVIPPLIS